MSGRAVVAGWGGRTGSFRFAERQCHDSPPSGQSAGVKQCAKRAEIFFSHSNRSRSNAFHRAPLPQRGDRAGDGGGHAALDQPAGDRELVDEGGADRRGKPRDR